MLIMAGFPTGNICVYSLYGVSVHVYKCFYQMKGDVRMHNAKNHRNKKSS